jgi:hypothetical protein
LDLLKVRKGSLLPKPKKSLAVRSLAFSLKERTSLFEMISSAVTVIVCFLFEADLPEPASGKIVRTMFQLGSISKGQNEGKRKENKKRREEKTAAMMAKHSVRTFFPKFVAKRLLDRDSRIACQVK